MSLFCSPLSLTDLQKKISATIRAYQSGAFAGTGVPILDSVLKNLTNSVNSALGNSLAIGTTLLQQKLQTQLAKWGITTSRATALAGLVTILNLGAGAQTALMSMMLDYFQTEVTLRYVLMQELAFHVNGILSLINSLNQFASTGTTDRRVQAALPFISKALQDLMLLQNTVGSSRPIINPIVFNDAASKINSAITILSSPAASINGANLAAVVASRQMNALTKYASDTVLSQQEMFSQLYIWHLTNYVTILTGGIAPLGWSINDLQPNNGARSVNQMITDRQQEFDAKKKALETQLSLGSDLVQTIDANKGLVVTNTIIANTAEQILDFTVNWSNLSSAAKVLWYSFTPAISILQNVIQQSTDYLLGDTKTINVNFGLATPIFTTAWAITQLEAAQTDLQIISPSVASFAASSNELAAFTELQNYLQSIEYATAADYIDKLISLGTNISWAAIAGPFSNRELTRAAVAFKQCQTYINAAIHSDLTILQLISNFSIINDPGAQAVLTAMQNLSSQSPEAAALLSTAVNNTSALGTLMIGAYQTVLAPVTLTSTAVSGIKTLTNSAVNFVSDSATTLSSLLAKVFGPCPTAGSKTALTNSNVEKLDAISSGNRQTLAAERAYVPSATIPTPAVFGDNPVGLIVDGLY